MTTRFVFLPAAALIAGLSFPAGEYLVNMPEDYDPEYVTAYDLAEDTNLQVILSPADADEAFVLDIKGIEDVG